MFKDEIAAVILNYRRADLTKRCVESLVGQITLALVVDNSEDEEEAKCLIDSIGALDYCKTETDIEVISSGKNLGFGRGVGYGIKRVIERGDFDAVLVINNDAVAGEGMVDGMLKTLRAHGNNALVAAKTEGKSVTSVLWYHRLFALVLRQSCPGSFPYLSGACVLVPMSLAKDGLFDPDFFMYGEDVEMGWRMNQSGVSLKVADVTYDHIGSASSGLGSLIYEFHLAKSHILLARKLAKNRLEWSFFLIGRSISLPLRATLRSFRYKSLIPWWALILACLGKSP
ncbi:MAG: glycosyltransferase family 2 protein [Proteobacteria bacterium]|nr:glycosyltransferase family 2 protein [Pseudomonadota bacterium]